MPNIEKESLSEIIKESFKNRIFENSDNLVVTDIHIQPFLYDNYVYVYDDDDNLLSEGKCLWSQDVDREAFYNEILGEIKLIIKDLKDKKFFNDINIFQPFSVVLIDENKETICDVDIVDNDTIVLSDDLLDGWEEELDDFIEKLLRE